MSESMLPRQRVLVALSHQEPDRVPLALGGGPYGLVDDLYLRLVRHLELGNPVPPFRSGHNISYMDDRLLERLGTDLRYCWPGLLPNSPIYPGSDPDTYYDSYGQEWKRAIPYSYAGKGLLEEHDEIDDIDRLVHWPDDLDPRWTNGVADRARALRTASPYFVVMRMVASHGPFQTACDLRGTTNFLTDLAARPEYAAALLDRITTAQEGLLRLAMQAGGQWFDMIELPGDDYAGNQGPLISPAMFRRFVCPCITRLVTAVRVERPDIKIMLHSDGAIARLLPDLAELGIDVIHPLEPLPATDMAAVKTQFGGRISFLGGIDISHAMPSTRQAVQADVERCLRTLAPGGGYILAPSNHLQADVPAENVVTLFETAARLGSYPIHL